MHFPRRTSRPPRHRLTESLRKQFTDILSPSSGGKRSCIFRDDLRSVWEGNQIRRLLSHIVSEQDCDFVRQKLLKVVSILVFIHWDRWSDFGTIFLCHRNNNDQNDRLDADLPFKDCSFLDSFQIPFSTFQCIFSPVIIEQGGTKEVSSEERLPFTHSSDVVGQGGFGEVTRCVIARGHFLDAAGCYNTEEKCVARKRIEILQCFADEIRNLDLLRESLSTHQSVMIHLATLVRGNEFNIFFPWADLDLHHFIYEEQDKFSHLKCPSILVDEASNLADALDFLHERIRIPGRGNVSCVHMDLKPENVVVRVENSLNDMRWMITDFGISTMKEPAPIDLNRLATPQDLRVLNSARDVAANLTGITPRRNPGPFQAPEVQEANARLVGRKSDIWSFGCILSLVLALASGRSKAVQAIDRARRGDPCADNYFYRKVPDSIAEHHQLNEQAQKGSDEVALSSDRCELNIGVLNYLKEMPAKSRDADQAWISSFVTVILETLNIPLSKRPWAAQVYERLNRVSSLIKSTTSHREEITVFLPPHSGPSSPLQAFSHAQSELPAADAPSFEQSGSPHSTTNPSMNLLSSERQAAATDRALKEFLASLGREKSGPTKGTIRTAFSPCSENVALIAEENVAVYHSLQLLRSLEGNSISITESTPRPIYITHSAQSKFVGLNGCFLFTAGDLEFTLHRLAPNADFSQRHSSNQHSPVPQVINISNFLEGVRTEKLLNATMSAKGDVLLAFNSYLILWRLQERQAICHERLNVEGYMQKASFNNDGSYVYAWTTPLDQWYAWDIQSVESRLRYRGRCNLHRVGSPIQSLIAFGETPPFVVRQGQNIFLVQERSVRTTDPRCILQLKGTVLFERFAALFETLVFVQMGKLSLLPITHRSAGPIQIGSLQEYTLKKRRRRACDIAVIGDKAHIPLQIFVFFEDDSFERVEINHPHDVI